MPLNGEPMARLQKSMKASSCPPLMAWVQLSITCLTLVYRAPRR